jgi:hypothetical protein
MTEALMGPTQHKDGDAGIEKNQEGARWLYTVLNLMVQALTCPHHPDITSSPGIRATQWGPAQ